MKYTEIDSFKKHIESSFPSSLAHLYLVIVSENFERQRIIDNITCYLPRNSSLSILKFEADKTSIKEIIVNLETPSLLGGWPIVILDEIDLFGRKEILELVSYLKEGKLQGYFILASKDKKSILTLLSEVDRRGLVLDISTEKPWVKERRLRQFMVEKCAQAKKSITQEAKETILSFLGGDMSAIEKEIEKAIIYVGDKPSIEKNDILLICNNINSLTVWQMAETIVWGETPFSVSLEKEYSIDSIFFHSLIIALRYNLEEGLKISTAIEKDLNLPQTFPTWKPKIFQNKVEMAARLKSSFFREINDYLFEIDLLSKGGTSSFLTLIDLFRIKLAYLKNRESYDHSTT
jgi:DNA polymerase III delta subunit